MTNAEKLLDLTLEYAKVKEGEATRWWGSQSRGNLRQSSDIAAEYDETLRAFLAEAPAQI